MNDIWNVEHPACDPLQLEWSCSAEWVVEAIEGARVELDVLATDAALDEVPADGERARASCNANRLWRRCAPFRLSLRGAPAV
eukprot:8213508-Lingulodinium_polyedra.AAC.1